MRNVATMYATNKFQTKPEKGENEIKLDTDVTTE